MAMRYKKVDAELGALAIDWAARKITFHGMDGNGEPMTAEAVVALVDAEAGKPDVAVWPLLYWRDNDQLSVHDRDSFLEEVEADDADGEDDDDAEADEAAPIDPGPA